MKKTVIVLIFIFGGTAKEPDKKPVKTCTHEQVYADPDILGDITPTIRCRDCPKRWNYPGTIYLEQGKPEALKQLREYEAMQLKLR